MREGGEERGEEKQGRERRDIPITAKIFQTKNGDSDRTVRVRTKRETRRGDGETSREV